MSPSVKLYGKLDIDEKYIGVFVYQRLKRKEAECPVCQENVERQNTTMFQCGHQTCITCMGKLMVRRLSCPMCRGQIRSIYTSNYALAEKITGWML
jgi:hypothetical protein